METTPQTSFIPSDATQTTRVSRGGGSGLADLFTLVSVVLLVASGALGVGVFLYNQFLQSSLTSKIEQLKRASAAFEPALIQDLTRLDDRMRVASEVLGRHIAPSAFFHMLEETTIQTTSFRSLNFEAVDGTTMTIRMSGVADSVNSIAFQADLFSKIGMITSPIFSNIDRQLDGVRFDLTAHLNPTALNYAVLVRELSQNLPEVTPKEPVSGEEGSSPSPSPFTNDESIPELSPSSGEGRSLSPPINNEPDFVE